MTDQAETSSNHPILNPDAFHRYVIHDPREIALLLDGMVDKRTLLSAYVGGGALSFVTAILGITDDRAFVILDASPEEHINDRAVAAGQITCITQVGGVRIQFDVEEIERFPHDGLSALRAPIPIDLLRLQRRESYRLAVPMNNPVRCEITFRAEDDELRTIEVRVLDISTNGLSISAPADEIFLTLGMELDDCLIWLPDAVSSPVRMRVRNLYHTISASGARTVRAGCQFVDLPGKFMTRIQRYIFTVERDRRQLETGA